MNVTRQIVGIWMLIIIFFASCSTEDTDIVDPLDKIAGEGGSAVSGSGTASDPYILSTAEHLDVFMRKSPESNYRLKNDIDLSAYISENYASEGWLPVNGFKGVFDGAGFKISGLQINRPGVDNVGFFGTLGKDDNSNVVSIEIKNITIEVAPSGSVTGKSFVGTLVGIANDGLGLTNVHVRGGDEKSQVLSAETTNTTDLGRSGGLIGLADRCRIISCSSTIKVVSSGGGRIGGLAGMINTTIVDQCYATGDVIAQFEDVGGLIGFAFNKGSAITNSYATGNIVVSGESADDIGAFVGATHSSFTPANCYATGNLTISSVAVDSYGFFSGDGDGGTNIFGATSQTIVDGEKADISKKAVAEEEGFKSIDISTSTCVDFSVFDKAIWSCKDGSFPVLINNP